MIQIHWILRQMPKKDLGSVKIPDPGSSRSWIPDLSWFLAHVRFILVSRTAICLLICVQKFQVDILKMTRVMILTWPANISHFSRHLSLFCKFQLYFFWPISMWMHDHWPTFAIICAFDKKSRVGSDVTKLALTLAPLGGGGKGPPVVFRK